MTPPTAVAGTSGTTLPRRRSAPARPARPARPAAPRVPRRQPGPARLVQGVLDAPLLDRLVRGSGWIPLVALGLMGIVFMQVSMLKLNAGIGRAVQTSATLERQNSELRNQVSRLDGNARIEGVARRSGMVVPAAGSFRYVTARPGRTDAREAARGISAPAPVQPGSAQQTQQTATPTTATPTTAAPAPAATPTATPSPTPTPTPAAQAVTPPAAGTAPQAGATGATAAPAATGATG